MVMKKSIKIDDETLKLLADLKVWYARQDGNDEITFDRVINELMFEHTLNTNPEIQRKKKEKILEEYVPRSAHDSAEARGEGWMKKYLTLDRENRTKKVELDAREKRGQGKRQL